jgi:hypothetical protein
MTPEEIQRTMDFILRVQADAAARHDELNGTVNTLSAITADLVEISRRSIERASRIEDSIVLLTRIADLQSQRLDRLENPG